MCVVWNRYYAALGLFKPRPPSLLEENWRSPSILRSLFCASPGRITSLVEALCLEIPTGDTCTVWKGLAVP